MFLKHLICGLFGLSAGIFTGYVSMALAQIIQVWTFKIPKKPMMYIMALGKIAGAFYYFIFM